MTGILFLDMRYRFLAGLMFLVAVVVGPIFWHMWIYAGNANANFFFASTVVNSLAQVGNSVILNL